MSNNKNTKTLAAVIHTYTQSNLTNRVGSRILKTVIFFTIFITLWKYTFSILWVDKNSITYFYEEPKNSIDVVYIGASNVYQHFNSVFAYNLYGFTTGILSSSAQPFPSIKYLIKETKKYQKPQLYIIDMGTILNNLNENTEEAIRITTDSMKFSSNRINLINELLNYVNINKDRYFTHYFSFLVYHNKWKNITRLSFADDFSYYKGYHFDEKNVKTVGQNNFEWSEKIMDLSSDNKDILVSLIDYIKQNNLNVLFTVPIKCYDEVSMEKMNTAIKLIKDNNLNIINFNSLNDFKIDFSSELYDINHINVYGATRFTSYLSKYLKQNYVLPDHRNDIKYSSWESEYERFKKSYKYLTDKDFEELI